MADLLNQPEFHEAVSQQAEGPALPPLGGRATCQRTQVGFHLAGDFPGRTRREGRMVERRGQARCHEAAADMAARVPMAAQRLGASLVCEGGCLIAIQPQQNPGPRVRLGRSAARPEQGIQGRTLVVG
jgi:hypothetical protein